MRDAPPPALRGRSGPSTGGSPLAGSLRSGLLIALLGVAACGPGPSAWAQVRDDEDEVEAPMPANQHFMIDESNFDVWVFGGSRNASIALARLEALSHLRIDELDRFARLTGGQKQKLELASRGDIKRFFDKVEEKRKAFQAVRNDQQKFGEFYQQLAPLQQALNQGLFGDDSLFAKTLRASLDPRQVADYDVLLRQRRVLHHQAKLGRVLATLDGSLGLESSQRQRLSKLIVEETRPPLKFTAYDTYVVLSQLAQLPEERIRPIFRDTQWPAMKLQLDQAKRIRFSLTKQGVLPDGPNKEAWAVTAEPEAPKSSSDEKKPDSGGVEK